MQRQERRGKESKAGHILLAVDRGTGAAHLQADGEGVVRRVEGSATVQAGFTGQGGQPVPSSQPTS